MLPVVQLPLTLTTGDLERLPLLRDLLNDATHLDPIGVPVATKTYYGLEIRQTPESKPFYLLTSSAAGILEWAGVPRKQEDFLAGYQRQLNDRHETIADYFTHPESKGRNIIPSSIIIAADQGKVSVTPAGDHGLFRIDITVDAYDPYVLLSDTVAKLRARLSDDELASIKIADDDYAEEDDEGGEVADTPPESYLAVIVKKLQNAGDNMQNLESEFKDAVLGYLSDVSKPGLILDGQHRVYGAKNVNAFDVQLPVVLLPGLEYSEQVFHFYVLNNKAKPLNKTELRAIISTSLSNKEIEGLYDRFKQVGVTAEETGWTYKINTDKDSPFQGLVNFGLNNSSKAPIGENVAYQVVSKFIKLPRKYRLLYEGVKEWGADIQQGSEYRLELFYALWRAVRGNYPNAWQKATESGGQILQKVNLLILQEFLLDKLVGEMPKRKVKGELSPFSDPNLLEEEVKFQLVFLSEEFFTKEWKMKGLDTAAGHKVFRESIDEAVSSQSQNLGNRKLFRASSA